MSKQPALPEIPSKQGLLLLPRAVDTVDFKLTSLPIVGKARRLSVRWNFNDPNCPAEVRTDEHGNIHYIWR